MTQTLYIPFESTAVSLGADQLATDLSSLSLENALDLRLIRTGSRGALFLEPLVEFEKDGVRHGLGPVYGDQASALKDALAGGAPLSSLDSYLGPIDDLAWFQCQDRLIFDQAGLVDPLDMAGYQQRGGLAGLNKSAGMEAQAIVDAVKVSGLRGRGGAAFPTGIKWQTVLDTPADQKYIVCNADEGDSGTFSDRLLMEGQPLMLIEGMAIAALAVGATKGFIYLRSEYPLAAQILTDALTIARESGMLGAAKASGALAFDIELRMGAGAYICGEETSLLESLEGKRGQVRAKPPLPAIEGLFGKPTVVNNVITFASLPFILRAGGKAYADYGVGRSTGTLPFQLAGNIKNGGLIEKAFGLSLRTLIEDIGGGTRSGRPVGAVQIGGPLGAYLGPADLDVALDYEALSAVGAMLGHGGIVVFDDTIDFVAQARYAMEFCAHESCGKCTPCRIGSVRGVEVVDQIASGVDVAQNKALLDDLCDTMEGASLCAMGGMTPYPVRSAMALAEKLGPEKSGPEKFGGDRDNG